MRRDAEHLTQAVCNECDVFLTRDHKTIIDPMRDWLEARYPRIRLPSELLAEMEQTADCSHQSEPGGYRGIPHLGQRDWRDKAYHRN
jgi:hypothetical protein